MRRPGILKNFGYVRYRSPMDVRVWFASFIGDPVVAPLTAADGMDGGSTRAVGCLPRADQCWPEALVMTRPRVSLRSS